MSNGVQTPVPPLREGPLEEAARPDPLRGVSRETIARLEDYARLLRRWQSRINLVGSATLPELWWRHIADSAQLATIIGDRGRRIVDIGSGAGFPGLVLAALGFEDVHLIEADARKCAFLREAARALGVRPNIHCARAEAMPGLAADVVTARAVAPLARLLAFAAPHLKSGTVALFLKGGRYEEELTDSARLWDSRVAILRSVTDPTGVILRLEAISRATRRGSGGESN